MLLKYVCFFFVINQWTVRAKTHTFIGLRYEKQLVDVFSIIAEVLKANLVTQQPSWIYINF